MASDIIRTFLEDRLKALDPGIDLEPGSPAQTQFIGPVMQKLGTDPFEVPIKEFLSSRFRQEFPDLYADDPSVINDLMVKPLILLLEPFKREIEQVRINQSLRYPELLSDDDAESLVANFFDSREPGRAATGVVRVFYSRATHVNVELTVRFYTSTGLSFFPVSPITYPAEQMVFNRSGSLYYMDIPVRAEKEGSEYNVEPGSIIGVDGLSGAVKVTNPLKISYGVSKVSTEALIAGVAESLTERSLTSRRGAPARIRQVFQGSVRSVQVVGASDPEMQRDILIAEGTGHAWITGRVGLYGNIALVQSRTVDSAFEGAAPSPGDTLYLYLDPYSLSGRWGTLPQSRRVVKVKVSEVLVGPVKGVYPYQDTFLLRWEGELESDLNIPDPVSLEGGLIKKGTVKIASIQGSDSYSTVPSGEVHVFGHTDVYVRPILQPVSSVSIDQASSEDSLIEGVDLETFGAEVSDKNKVSDLDTDFSSSGVSAGDVLVIESGPDAGTYTIGKVDQGDLYLTQPLTETQTGIHYRILSRVRINPFSIRTLKFPFGGLQANDLQTVIGESTFWLSDNDLLDFRVGEGDIIRLLNGQDQGDYTIVGFDSVVGGKGVIVDRPAFASGTGISYEVFSPHGSVERPLVRIRDISLLDSSSQSTGIDIPPADPVAVVPMSDFAPSRVLGKSSRKSGYVLPDLSILDDINPSFLSSNVPAPSGDRRYSLGFDSADGTYKSVQFEDGSYAEFSFRDDSVGKCSYFLATAEHTDGAVNFPPIDPVPGDILSIKNGPNKGGYLIKKVHKFKYKVDSETSAWSYFIQIHGEFPVDPFRQVLLFLKDRGVQTGFESIPDTIQWSTFFKAWLDGLGAKLASAIGTVSGTAIQDSAASYALKQMTEVSYEWGQPSRGVLRSYFVKPVLLDLRTDSDGELTTFTYRTSGTSKVKFCPAPGRYDSRQVVPPVGSDPYRDLEVSGQNVSFADTSRSTMFDAGVRPGDVLSVHEEFLLHGDKSLMTGVQTYSGLNTVDIPECEGPLVSKEHIGSIVYIEEGEDLGKYTVVDVQGRRLYLDSVLGSSTPSLLAQGSVSEWGLSESWSVIRDANAPFNSGHAGRWVTLFGVDMEFQGSYEILEVVSSSEIKVDASTPFPPLASTTTGKWAISAAPTTSPEPIRSGTELYALRPIRMYHGDPKEFSITDVVSDGETSGITVDGLIRDGEGQPYRVTRSGTRRITPTEMSESMDGRFYYVDLDVVSLGAYPSADLKKGSYLEMDRGSYSSAGYRHEVSDSSLSYSTREEGYLDLPTSILPVGLDDLPENYVSIVGSPIEISYERAELVADVQRFIESSDDRNTSANMLARHLLPAYVSYDASYVGGSSVDVVGEDVSNYIDSIPVESPIDVSEILERIIRRGGDPITPTRVSLLAHGWDRRMTALFSENEVGGSDLPSFFSGTSRICHYVPGKVVSSDQGSGSERIKLIRR